MADEQEDEGKAKFTVYETGQHVQQPIEELDDEQILDIEPADVVAADDPLGAFLVGQALPIQSSWLGYQVQYVADHRELKVWFKDGYTCTVENISIDEAVDFYTAPSKGTWYHERVLGPGYFKKPKGQRISLKTWRNGV